MNGKLQYLDMFSITTNLKRQIQKGSCIFKSGIQRMGRCWVYHFKYVLYINSMYSLRILCNYREKKYINVAKRRKPIAEPWSPPTFAG